MLSIGQIHNDKKQKGLQKHLNKLKLELQNTTGTSEIP